MVNNSQPLSNICFMLPLRLKRLTHPNRTVSILDLLNYGGYKQYGVMYIYASMISLAITVQENFEHNIEHNGSEKNCRKEK